MSPTTSIISTASIATRTASAATYAGSDAGIDVLDGPEGVEGWGGGGCAVDVCATGGAGVEGSGTASGTCCEMVVACVGVGGRDGGSLG